MRNLTLRIGGTLILLCASAEVLAQSTIPEDVRNKMNGFVGVWDFEETQQTSASSPNEKVAGTWEARWLYESLIEWRGVWKSEGGDTQSVEYEGYDPEKQEYTYWFASDGGRGHAFDGEWNGNTLTIQFIQIEKDGTRQRGRCTWPYNERFTELNNYTCETLTDGTWWVSRRGNAQKRVR